MSEQTTEGTPTPEDNALTVGTDPAAQMSAILDFLAPETTPEENPEGTGADTPAEVGVGQQPAPAEGTGPDAEPAAAPDGRDPQQPAVPPAGEGGTPPAAEPGGEVPQPAAGAVDATTLSDTWGEIATAFETSQTEQLENAALSEVREEYKEYFERLEQHPRMLVGQEVRSLTGDGTEVLRDAADAKDWQDAAKHLLVQEVRSRVESRRDELRDAFSTVHSSIDLFRNNVDLVPGTQQFDKELADEFARMASAYEQRIQGKLIGYSVPVQPLINQLRSRLQEQRAQKAAQQQQPSPQQQRAAQQPRNDAGQWTGPQAGITSKAGSAGSGKSDVASELYEAFARQNGFRI